MTMNVLSLFIQLAKCQNVNDALRDETCRKTHASLSPYNFLTSGLQDDIVFCDTVSRFEAEIDYFRKFWSI